MDNLHDPVGHRDSLYVQRHGAGAGVERGEVVDDDLDHGGGSGGAVHATVTNTGNVTLTGITVSDPNCTSAISGPTGDTNGDGQLQVTETWVYTCSHTVTQAEIDTNGGGDGDLDNTVTADSTNRG